MSEDDESSVSVDDNLNYKSISCENIPELFLDKLIAKKHFGQFGKINRFILRPKRLSCTVEYESKQHAENAFVSAGTFNGQYFDIRYTPYEVSHTKNTEEWVDPDVQAELDAMGNTVRSPSRMMAAKAASVKTLKPILKPKQVPEIIPRVDNSMKSELEAILRRQASDSEEKYRILDARDKLIRLTTFRTTDIKKAISTKGICPDMCPEKERLMREAQYQVSSFEMDDGARGELNHKIAIKEYSRSSADQEAPLAHELRSEAVLKMTMAYLMHEIMDLCEEPDINIGDWFHFVWDRTRSIRKDITQQELCSLNSVQLVEQCARFHVHCAARLIAEDPSVFDQKINTENLTKCLQTLKYMYHDLRLKNVCCPNEAEFRAYIILLNLNDSNFLWEVNQLPVEVQNSPQLRFALSVFLAVENNNYIRFFQLVRETTYLNACILLRYFTQVRIQALRTIIKAYNPPRNSIYISVAYLSDTLAFDSVDAAAMFFEYYGLPCEIDRVLLDKSSFYMPDVPFIMERSLSVIEAKRQTTVGEAVCGQKIEGVEQYRNHVIHNSFDENGYLKLSAWNAEDQLRGSDARKRLSIEADNRVFKVPLASPPISPKQQLKSSVFGKPATAIAESKFPIKANIDESGQQNSRNIFSAFSFTSNLDASQGSPFDKPKIVSSEEIEQQKRKSIFGGFAVRNLPETGNVFALSIAQPSVDARDSGSSLNLFKPLDVDKEIVPLSGASNVNFSFTQDKAQEKFEQEMELKAERDAKKLEKEQMWLKSIEEENRLKADEEAKRKRIELEVERNQIETARLKRVEEEKKEKRLAEITRINKSSNDILESFLIEIVDEFLKQAASEELLAFEKKIAEDFLTEFLLETVMEIAKQESFVYKTKLTRTQELMQKYFRVWKENAHIKLTRRRLLESGPIWAQDHELREDAIKVALPLQRETLRMMRRYRLGVPDDLAVKSPDKNPINLIQLCLQEFSNRRDFLLKSRKYFKLVISLPREGEEAVYFNSFMNGWLNKVLVNRQQSQSGAFLVQTLQNVAICVRKVEGVLPMNEKRQRVSTECDNADAILFVMTSGDLENSQRRLHHLLKLSQINTKIPVAVIACNSKEDEDTIEERLQLGNLAEHETVSEYAISLTTETRIREIFKDSVRFLLRSTEQICPLEMQNFCSFLRNTLGDEFWKRLGDSWMINPSFREVCLDPNQLIDLYNKAIGRLLLMIEEDFDDYPEFPAELKEFVPNAPYDIPVGLEHFPLDWKSNHRISKLKSFLKSLVVGDISIKSNKLRDIEEMIFKYAKFYLTDERIAYKSGCNSIKNLLENATRDGDEIEVNSWLDVVKPICLDLLAVKWNEQSSKHIPTEIIYKKEVYLDYITNPWWFEEDLLKSIIVEFTSDEEEGNDETSSSSVLKRSFEFEDDMPKLKRMKLPDGSQVNLDEIMAKGAALAEKANQKNKKYQEIVDNSRLVAKDFDAMLYRQGVVTRGVDRFLENSFRN